MQTLLIAAAGLAAGLWLLFRLGRALAALRGERAENQQLRKIILSWRLQSDAQDRKLEELRKARHDLRHYLCALRGAEPAGLSSDLRDDLAQEQACLSGDWALSALMNYYCLEAARIGVQTDCRLDLHGAPNAFGADLYLIVSNLMENAVESLRQEGGGWLRARSLSSPGWFSLVIGNSCSHPLRVKNGRFLSGKAPGRYGIGLDSVRRVAERYGGKAQFTANGKEFRASVFLPLPAFSTGEEPSDTASPRDGDSGSGEGPSLGKVRLRGPCPPHSGPSEEELQKSAPAGGRSAF